MRIVIAIVIWAAAVVGAVAVSSAVSSSIHNRPASAATAGAGFSSGNSGSSVDPSSITATDQSSLFRTANLAKALAKARSALGADAQLDNFALYPGYLSITAVKGSNEVDFYVDETGNVQQTASPGSAGGTAMFRLSQIGAGIPAALAQRISTAAHVPTSQLHYVVVMVDPVSGHGLWWLVYPVQGNAVEYFKASGATGRLLEYRTNSSTGLQPVP